MCTLRAFSRGRSWRTARTAARWALRSNVVTTRSPPRSMSWSEKPFGLELAADRVEQVVVGATLGLARVGGLRHLHAGPLRRVEPALGHHAVEHVVEAVGECLGVLVRVVVGRRPDHRGEDGALLDRELGGRLVEVGLRGRLDAVGAAAEVDGVEVVGEDLVLVVAAVQLHRDEELLELAGVGPLLRQVRVLGVLLGDGRPALLGAAAQVVPERAGDAGRRDAAVLVERAVLGREHRLLHGLGHLVQRDDDPVLLAEAADLGLAVVVVDDRGLRADQVVGLRDRRHGVGDADRGHHAQEADAAHGEQLSPRRHVAADPVVVTAGVVDSHEVPVRQGTGAGASA